MVKRRSPVLGYNHNVRYHGRIFHIQTEDSGPGNPHLFTHLFYEGTILSSKKEVYDVEIPETDVRGLMQELHKAMMKELKQSAFDDKIASFFAARGEPASLEEPEMAIPAVGPGAGVARALDLDAIPSGPTPSDTGGVPAPMAPPSSSGRMTTGAGVYVERTAKVDRPFSPKTPAPVVESIPMPRTRRQTGTTPVIQATRPSRMRRLSGPVPMAGDDAFDAAARGQGAPPPNPSAASGVPEPIHGAGGSAGIPGRRPTPDPLRPTNAPPAPVVVLQPVQRASRPSVRSAPSAEGVVVQRQVVVGVGGNAPAAPAAPVRPQRTQRSMPYVIAGATRTAAQPPVQPVIARPAAPVISPPAEASAPAAPSFRDDVDTDRSLDDVILAYLAEDTDLPSE